ncbi:hypothetical protein AB6A40_009580 [Gnathostoma spinigerum]|uniref:Uncharacterized protein n=1 Tax=Gnathostoma spinigerum TaxID=75299 RepID=A0ABD6EZD7_9BILA
MNYDQQQQQYMMQQGQRMQNSRLMAMPGNMGQQHMQRQQRFTMTMGQPSQQPMQLPPNQYVQGASMQTRPQITMNEALMRLPPEIQTQAQQQISAETNPERKRAIAMNFFTTHRMRMTSSFPNPTTSSILVNVNGSQPVGLQQTNLANNQLIRMGPAQGGVMPQVSIFQGQHQMQQQNMPTVTSGQVTMQRVGAHGYIPQSSIPTTSNQMMQSVPVTHEQQSQAVTIPNYNSPQSIAIPQPSSVGPPVVQQLSSLQQKGPSSVPSAIYAQHHRTGLSVVSSEVLAF